MLAWCALARAPPCNTTLVNLPVRDRCEESKVIDEKTIRTMNDETTDETMTEAANGLRNFEVTPLGVSSRHGLWTITVATPW